MDRRQELIENAQILLKLALASVPGRRLQFWGFIVSVYNGICPGSGDALFSLGSGAGSGKPTDGVFSLNVPFAKGTISVQVRVTGDAFTPTHLARVRKYLELAEQEWDGGDE